MGQPQLYLDPEMLRKLEVAVSSMPRERREIFLANRVDGLSYRTIAEVTGLTERQVERNMADALIHIMKQMDFDEALRTGLIGRILQLPIKFL